MTFGIGSDSESYLDSFGASDIADTSNEIEEEENGLELALNEAIYQILDNEYRMPSIEEGLNDVFTAIYSFIGTLSLKEVVDTLEALLGAVKKVNLSESCLRIMVSNFIEINLSLQESLSRSQIEQYPRQDEWQEYFKRLNHLFGVEEEKWEEMCFCYIEHQAQIPLYSFDLFTTQLDAITFLVVAGREKIVWTDYEEYYDKLMEKFLERFQGTEFGASSFRQYALIENGREVSESMGKVFMQYLLRPSLEVSEAFELIKILRHNREISYKGCLFIVKAMIAKVGRQKVYEISDYKEIMSLFLIPSTAGLRTDLWLNMHLEISTLLKKTFTFNFDGENVMRVRPLKDEDAFAKCKKEMEGEIALWSHCNKIDLSIQNYQNQFLRYLLSCMTAHLNSSNAEQTVVMLELFHKFTNDRKLGGLVQKKLLAVVLGAIELEHLRNGADSNLIVEYCEKSRLFDSSWLPIIEKFGGRLLFDSMQIYMPSYPLIQTIARLLNLKESEILLRVAPGIINLPSFQLCCAQAFNEEWEDHPLSDMDTMAITEVIKCSKLLASANSLIVYIKGFNLSSEMKLSLTELLLDRALNKKVLMHDDLIAILNLLSLFEAGGTKDELFKRCGTKIELILLKRFSLRNLMKVTGAHRKEFTLSYYYNLFSMCINVIDQYGLNKEEMLPLIHYHWILEGVSSLRIIKASGVKKLEETKFLVVRRKRLPGDLFLLEVELSRFKGQVLKMIVNSYNYLSAHSNEFKADADKRLTPFIDRGYYEQPMRKESCLTFKGGKLTISACSH